MHDRRDQLLDFSKGILICLVIIGHIIQYGSGSEYYNSGAYFNNWIMKFIYSFHMPLFVFISGYLTRFSYEKTSPGIVLRNRLRKLCHPIIAWTPIIVFFSFFINHTHIDIRYVVNVFLTSFWFLWALILSNVCLYITEHINKNYRILSYIFLILVALISPDVLWTHAYKYTIPFFFFGYYKAKITRTYEIKHAYFWVIMFAVLLIFYNKESYIYTSMYSLLGKHGWNDILRQLYIDFYRYIIAAAGCATMIYLWKKIWDYIKNRKYSGKILCNIGRHSLAIYIISTIIFEFVFPHLSFIQGPSFLAWTIEFVIVITVCWIASIVIGKVKLLSKVLGI